MRLLQGQAGPVAQRTELKCARGAEHDLGFVAVVRQHPVDDGDEGLFFRELAATVGFIPGGREGIDHVGEKFCPGRRDGRWDHA